MTNYTPHPIYNVAVTPNGEIMYYDLRFSPPRPVYSRGTYDGRYMSLQHKHNSKRIKLYVHRLVLETFTPNTHNLPHVNHIDGDKTNNKLSNLEWASVADNLKHSYDTKLHKPTGRCGQFMLMATGEIFPYDNRLRLAKVFNCPNTTLIDSLKYNSRLPIRLLS